MKIMGGETNFEWTKVKGKTGMGLIFPHHLVHQGNAVLGDERKICDSYRCDLWSK
jgi:hypothetical protein